MKRAVEVSIMGQKFNVRSDSDEAYIAKVAEYVDAKIKDVIQKTKSVASLNVAILAAMNITDEFFKSRQDKDQRFKELDKKVEDLIELIDVQL